MTGAALLGRFGLRPTRPSSARMKTLGGSDLLRRIDGKWVRFKSALTKAPRIVGSLLMFVLLLPMLKLIVAFMAAFAVSVSAQPLATPTAAEEDQFFRDLALRPKVEQDSRMRVLASGMAEMAPHKVDRYTTMTSAVWIPASNAFVIKYAVDLKGEPLDSSQLPAAYEKQNLSSTCTNLMFKPLMEHLHAQVIQFMQFPDRSMSVTATHEKCRQFMSSFKP